jgi:hypothetical protein
VSARGDSIPWPAAVVVQPLPGAGFHLLSATVLQVAGGLILGGVFARQVRGNA